MKTFKYKAFLWSWWRIIILDRHNCTGRKYNSNFFPQTPRTPLGELPIGMLLAKKSAFLSIIDSFILLLVLVPGYLQHPSINANCMKRRVLCDALRLLFALTTGESINKFVLYCLKFLAAYTSFHPPQDLTIAHVHLLCDWVNKTAL